MIYIYIPLVASWELGCLLKVVIGNSNKDQRCMRIPMQVSRGRWTISVRDGSNHTSSLIMHVRQSVRHLFHAPTNKNKVFLEEKIYKRKRLLEMMVSYSVLFWSHQNTAALQHMYYMAKSAFPDVHGRSTTMCKMQPAAESICQGTEIASVILASSPNNSMHST
jgi:hypothetical protein